MRKLLKAIGLVAALAGLGVAATRRQVRAIQERPDPFPADRLRADVVGDDHLVERPDGTKLAVRVAGEGRDVVLLHAYGAAMREFNIMQPLLLEAGFRTICMDYRGHGRTVTGSDGITPEPTFADLDAVLEEFDVEDCILVGHSTGGYISLGALLNHNGTAQRVAGLVLMASLAGDASAHSKQTALQIPLIQSGAMDKIAANDTTGPLFAATVCGPDPSATEVEVWLEDFLAADHQALVPLLERLAKTSFYDRLGEIDQPTVVICGEADATTPASHAEALVSGIPDATVVWVPDAAHTLNWRAPDVVVEAITELRNRISA